MNLRKKQRDWRFSTVIRLLLAGWRPTRNVCGRLTLPGSLSLFPEAKRVLAEFGNLRLGGSNDYVAIDPSVGGGELVQEIEICERGIGCCLYPIGVWFQQDEIHLVIDEHGHVYTPLSVRKQQQLQMCELEPLASSFERAIEFLIRRYKRRTRFEIQEDLRLHELEGKAWRFDASGALISQRP